MTKNNVYSKIEYWPLDRLVPYARNSRTHSDEQVAQIAASIREFGFTNPILVDTEAGILAGHARLLAAQSLPLAQVPVIVLDHLSEVQKRAYMLADNKLALHNSKSRWRNRTRSIRRFRLDADRMRKARPPGSHAGTGSEVRRCHRPPMAGIHGSAGSS